MNNERQLIGNIFGFNCSACEHNRNCYGGNMGNQFQVCQKSNEIIDDLLKIREEYLKLKKEEVISNEKEI